MKAENHSSRTSFIEPPTPEQRREQRLAGEAADLGYRLAVRCTHCKHWLVNAKSVAAHRGPVCRRKGDVA